MSYPPKHPSNGTRNHVPTGTERIDDAWPGDTATMSDGTVWQLQRDGITWTRINQSAKKKAA